VGIDSNYILLIIWNCCSMLETYNTGIVMDLGCVDSAVGP